MCETVGIPFVYEGEEVNKSSNALLAAKSFFATVEYYKTTEERTQACKDKLKALKEELATYDNPQQVRKSNG